MSKKRIVLGFAVGILCFVIISWIGKSAFQNLDQSILKSRSIFGSLHIKEPAAEILIYNLSTKEVKEFKGKSTDDEKTWLINLLGYLSDRSVNSAYFIMPFLSSERISEIEMEMGFNNFYLPILFVEDHNLELVKPGTNQWLNPRADLGEIRSFEDLLSDKGPPGELRDTYVVITSDIQKDPSQKSKLQYLMNYLGQNWVSYFAYPDWLLFFTISLFAVFFAALVYWARVIALLALIFLYLILGQILYSFFNIHLETGSIISVWVLIFVISNLLDFNLFMINQEQESPKPSPIQEKIKTVESPNIIVQKIEPVNDTSISLRNKFYTEQESNLEEIALKLQDKTVQNLVELQSKISEIISESQSLSAIERTKMKIIKHEFDEIVDNYDAVLFQLSPFIFESDRGLLDILDILTQKISYLSKNKVRVVIDSQITPIKYDLEKKINVFRIIEKLLEITIEAQPKSETAEEGKTYNIVLQINKSEDNKLVYEFNYDGDAMDASNNDHRMREIYKRMSCINADLDFGTDLKKLALSGLVNKIILKL